MDLVPGKEAKKNLRAYPLRESLSKTRKKQQREDLKREVGQTMLKAMVPKAGV